MNDLNEQEKNSSSLRPSGMRAFFVMWIGQFVSLLGSAITSFAIPIWVFGETERVQELALLGLAFYSINFYTLTFFYPWFFAMRNPVFLATHALFGAIAGRRSF